MSEEVWVDAEIGYYFRKEEPFQSHQLSGEYYTVYPKGRRFAFRVGRSSLRRYMRLEGWTPPPPPPEVPPGTTWCIVVPKQGGRPPQVLKVSRTAYTDTEQGQFLTNAGYMWLKDVKAIRPLGAKAAKRMDELHGF